MSERVASRRGPVFWVGVAMGWLFIVYGTRGVLVDHTATAPAGFARWFVGIAIVHDAVVAPVVLLIAWTVGRAVPRQAVVPVRLGLATTGLIVLYTWPFVRSYGRAETNPSALPLDYGRNLIGALIAVWLCVAAWIAIKSVRSQRQRGETNSGARR
jgi:hypothetical protein